MYKIQAFITTDILAFYKTQDFPDIYELKDLLTKESFIHASFAFTFLSFLFENDSIDSYVFLTSIYNDISNELKDQLDNYFKNHTERQFESTSYENSKLLVALITFFENHPKNSSGLSIAN